MTRRFLVSYVSHPLSRRRVWRCVKSWDLSLVWHVCTVWKDRIPEPFLSCLFETLYLFTDPLVLSWKCESFKHTVYLSEKFTLGLILTVEIYKKLGVDTYILDTCSLEFMISWTFFVCCCCCFSSQVITSENVKPQSQCVRH